MPVCRMCTQNYPNSQFVSGNGPRYQVCVRCAAENDMLAEGETTSLYSDELLKSRSALFARRYRPWAFLGAGWLLFLTSKMMNTNSMSTLVTKETMQWKLA